MYYYGGDHGEDVNDSNFCMDGLVYPDRTPHTGLLEYKNVYRPLRVEHFEQEAGTIAFRNYLDFTNAKDYIQIKYEVSCDGKIVEEGTIDTPSIAPAETVTIPFSVKVPETGSSYLKVSYYSAKDVALVPEGHFLGFDEIAKVVTFY